MVDKEPLKKYDMTVSKDDCDMVELSDIRWWLWYGKVLRDDCDVLDKENMTWLNAQKPSDRMTNGGDLSW